MRTLERWAVVMNTQITSKDRPEQLSAIFVGDSTLLVRCAEIALNAGWSVAAVVTADENVKNWADARGVQIVAKGQRSPAWTDLRADYLISAGNNELFPATALACARRLAINFHDGPLPHYAGLNVTSWALLQGETRHGITWHEITEGSNTGRIVEASEFDIDPSEGAFGLNAKCYEEGVAAFERIVSRIGANALQLSQQGGVRKYFARRKRVSSAATLDFTQSPSRVVTLVRALDRGPYPSPLGFPKIIARSRVYLVGAAAAASQASQAAPGTVVSACERQLIVATPSGDVRLENLLDLHGLPIAPKDHFTVGDNIAPLASDVKATLDAQESRASRSEEFWRKELFDASSVELPLPRTRDHALHATRLSRPSDVSTYLSAIAAWTTRVSGSKQVSIAYRSAAHDAALGTAIAWFQAWRPFNIACDPSSPLGPFLDATGAHCARVDSEGPISCDLHLRFGRGNRVKALPHQLPIALYVGAADGNDMPQQADLLFVVDPRSGIAELRSRAFDEKTVRAIASQIDHAVKFIEARGDRAVTVGDVGFAGTGTSDISAGPQIDVPTTSIADAVYAQARRSPDRVALKTRWDELTFAQAQRNIDRAARALAAAGVKPGDLVGVCMQRSCDLVVALLAVLRAGAAYVPLDPKFPQSRLDYMVADSGASIVIIDDSTLACLGEAKVEPIHIKELIARAEGDEAWSPPAVGPDALAYVMYTSGSTGRPKGVMISHGAVANFFVGMDARIPHDPPGTWLAVTSPSFDISVLELFWTLTRGFTVALHCGTAPVGHAKPGPDFSLFYFAAAQPDQTEPYRILFEGAKFADANGFNSVWMPERHFHDFGGPYPNPAVTAAAVAAQTKRVGIRAGSCVLPLHNPIRVAEDWSVIDVMSGGRVGLAIASGWQPTDFVLMPDAFADRKNLMLAHIETVRKLWRGEAMTFPGPTGKPHDIRILPRAVQPEIPLWLTAAGNPETFAAAGRIGCNVLTHMLGMSLAQVAENVRTYRAAWTAAGHPGHGRVTLMLHTFVGEDDDSVRDRVREPMKRYLATAVDLVRDASWSFPAFVQRAEQAGKTPAQVFEAEPITPEEMDALLEHAFNRYFKTSGLFGAPETCLAMVEKVAAIGVDEIACLVDFGVPTDAVLAHLELLKQVKERAAGGISLQAGFSVADDIIHFGATHMQCTPSMASMVAADPVAREALGRLDTMLVGGEALPLQLARELRDRLGKAKLLNMYGPTETTIWSTVSAIDEVGDFVSLGEAIANTTLQVAAPDGRPQLAPAAGELWIGGAGLAKGYWKRPDLTGERFKANALGTPMYRTGDLVRWHTDGRLEFLGRIDHQVKIRGHRIELGEIEAALEEIREISRAVVVARELGADDKRLVAYFVASPDSKITAETLRAALVQRLPEIMVPTAFVPLATFPMTPNGKIDRNALPAPVAGGTSAAAHGDAKGDLESSIAAIWCELLGVDRVSSTQNFFDLGGHSLLAVQMQRRLRTALERDISITEIFRFPTIGALARHLQGETTESAASLGRGRAKARLTALRRTRGALEEVENG